MDVLVGIDLGSTSLKAVAYDLDGNLVAKGSRPTEKFHPSSEHPEWTVWQPEQIWNGACQAIQQACSELPPGAKVLAVAVTGMGMDGVPVDKNGKWLYPFISWHDPRTAPQHQWWQEIIGAEKQFSIGGNPLWPINSALRILWMNENKPELMERANKWLLIEDFANFMLCGRYATDPSMASCTLLYDQRQRCWSDELIKLSKIDSKLLCEVMPSGTVLGEIHTEAAKATGLPAGTPVVLGGQDHICGTLPVGAFRPGVVLDVTGTWESVIVASAQPVLEDALRVAGITVQSHVARDRYAIWGGNVAGEMVEWFRSQMSGDMLATSDANTTDWLTLMNEAEKSPIGAGGIMFLPHMSAAASPVVDSKSLGGFVGLTPRTTRRDMLRAIVEGLDFQFLDILTAIEDSMGQPTAEVVAVGGATRNQFWMQNKADVVGRPIRAPKVEEASPLGAAILAGIGIGAYKDEEEAYERVSQSAVVFEPDETQSKKYAELFSIYRELYPSLKSVNHRLFEEQTT